MLQMVVNSLVSCLQLFFNLCGSLELAVVLFTILIRSMIMPFKYPVDLNYLNKSATKKYFEPFLQYIQITKDQSLIKVLKGQQKELKKHLKFLTLTRVILLISIQVFMLILFVRALTRLDDVAQVYDWEHTYLVGILLVLTSIDYFMKQHLSQQNYIGYIFPFILCLLMICASFFFTKLFLYYLVTTSCFNIISFYCIWIFRFPKLQLQAYHVFLNFYRQ